MAAGFIPPTAPSRISPWRQRPSAESDLHATLPATGEGVAFFLRPDMVLVATENATDRSLGDGLRELEGLEVFLVDMLPTSNL
jgi:hypothetical protein